MASIKIINTTASFSYKDARPVKCNYAELKVTKQMKNIM